MVSCACTAAPVLSISYWPFQRSWAFFTLALADSAVNGGASDIVALRGIQKAHSVKEMENEGALCLIRSST